MVSSERSNSNLSESFLFEFKKKNVFHKNQFLGDELKIYVFLQFFFFKLLPKFSDFINFDDCIWKPHQNLSDHIQFYSKNDSNLIRKGFISNEKFTQLYLWLCSFDLRKGFLIEGAIPINLSRTILTVALVD